MTQTRTCVFTKKIQPEAYAQVTDAEVVDALTEIVSVFVGNRENAQLVSIDDTEMRTQDEITPQPFVTATVEVDTTVQDALIVSSMSIIGDLAFYDEGVFPVQLLGPRYWVIDEQIGLDSTEASAGTESKGFVNTIVSMIDTYINGK